MKRFIPALRLWDIASANFVDRFIANSGYVAKRIRRYYNREAEVIYAPVPVERFFARERKPEDFYLFFGQITSYKRVDIALEACRVSGRKLAVAGAGMKKKTQKEYGKTGIIFFHGRVSDNEAADLYSRARALIFPGIEDLGLVPIEAAAAGCPVIAFREGGALDTVKENITGIFFDEQTPASLIGALDRFEAMEERFRDREPFIRHAARFSKTEFQNRIRAVAAGRQRI
jgi:glycosyltransferase involved in cell wall biosynthesis